MRGATRPVQAEKADPWLRAKQVPCHAPPAPNPPTPRKQEAPGRKPARLALHPHAPGNTLAIPACDPPAGRSAEMADPRHCPDLTAPTDPRVKFPPCQARIGSFPPLEIPAMARFPEAAPRRQDPALPRPFQPRVNYARRAPPPLRLHPGRTNPPQACRLAARFGRPLLPALLPPPRQGRALPLRSCRPIRPPRRAFRPTRPERDRECPGRISPQQGATC